MRLSSCGQVWKRGAKKRKLQKDEHASARVEAGISHRPTPLGVGAPRAKLQANGAQGLPPKRIERGVCSMVKRPARVLGAVPELPPAGPSCLHLCALGTPKAYFMVAHPQPLPLPWAPVSQPPSKGLHSACKTAHPGVATRSSPITQRQALHEWPFPVIVPPEALW